MLWTYEIRGNFKIISLLKSVVIVQVNYCNLTWALWEIYLFISQHARAQAHSAACKHITMIHNHKLSGYKI
jgi:hypothetical protein